MEFSASALKNIVGQISPNYALIGGLFLLLFLMPGLLVPLVPIAIIIYGKKFASHSAPGSGRSVKKTRDPRRGWLAFGLATSALLAVFVVGAEFELGMMLMIVLGFGVCTGGFIWFPLAAYLLSRLILFLYDRFTGNMKYRTPIVVPASAAPTPISVPTVDLTALSPNEQALALYISDAATRGVRTDEIALILKSNGWVPEDITNGFDLVRTYYPGVLR